MSDSLELKAAKNRITQAFREEFISLTRYDRSELVDSIFGDMMGMQTSESTWDEQALQWRCSQPKPRGDVKP